MINKPTNTFEILSWCNEVLQGQFRKYVTVMEEVQNLCIRATNSIEEANEWVKEINLAVARIICAQKDSQTDSQEVLEFADKLNNQMNLENLKIKNN